MSRHAAGERGRAARPLMIGLVAATLLALLGSAGSTAAQGLGRANPGPGNDAYWTAERLRDAKPLALPRATTSRVEAAPGAPSGPQRTSAGKPPTIAVEPAWNNKLFEPARVGRLESRPEAIGTSGLPFTTSRVFPDAAVSTYPYRAVGKLFFRDPRTGTNNVCTGSVINRRLILTAGHCVFDTARNYFFDNFLFVPAFRAGAAPFQQWSWAFVRTTTAWVNGTGSFPNDGDFAIIEAVDRVVGSGAPQRIGDVVGFLGFVTNSLIGQHVTTLGYPGNLDNGQRMQTTGAETRRVVGFNAAQLGSDQRGGSSGGPWIRDFGVSATGDPTATAQRNRVVGVTSYGPVAIGPRSQGSSILDTANFLPIYNAACARLAGNC